MTIPEPDRTAHSSHRPSRRLYLFAILLPLAGCVGAYAVAQWQLEAEVENMHRFRMPGSAPMQLAPGEHWVYSEFRSIVGGMSYEGGAISGLDCWVRGPGDTEVPIFSSSDESSYSAGPYAGELMFSFEVEEAATHHLSCRYGGGRPGQLVVMAVGAGIIGSVTSVMLIVVPVMVLMGLALVFAVYVKRKRAHRAPTAPPAREL